MQVPIDLDKLLKIEDVLSFIPMGKTAWNDGVRAGVFPPPVDFGGRKRFWRASDIRNLIATGIQNHEQKEAEQCKL